MQLHTLAIKIDGSDFEVDADCCDERGSERVFGEAEETAGFSNAGIAYEEEFDLCSSWSEIMAKSKLGCTRVE